MEIADAPDLTYCLRLDPAALKRLRLAGTAGRGPDRSLAAATGRIGAVRVLPAAQLLRHDGDADVTLNEATTGISQNGAAFYRDVAPGLYNIALTPTDPYPHQFKTVTVRPGDVYYVRIDTLSKVPCNLFPTARCSEDTFIMTLIDPPVGMQESQGLHLISG